jgi:hypothetical protein
MAHNIRAIYVKKALHIANSTFIIKVPGLGGVFMTILLNVPLSAASLPASCIVVPKQNI